MRAQPRRPHGPQRLSTGGSLARIVSGFCTNKQLTGRNSSGAVLGGGGIIYGGLTLSNGAKLAFDPDASLTVDGTVNLGNLSIDSLVGLTEDVEIQSYTLIAGDSTTWDFLGVQNWGEANKVEIGESGKYAYFDEGSLKLVVIPEPHTLGLLLAAGALLAARRRREVGGRFGA